MIHNLKTLPKYFQRVLEGVKPFEVRKMDRDFLVNDLVKLEEWDNITNEYTGRKLMFKIPYILEGGQFGIEKGYCVMTLEHIDLN